MVDERIPVEFWRTLRSSTREEGVRERGKERDAVRFKFVRERRDERVDWSKGECIEVTWSLGNC